MNLQLKELHLEGFQSYRDKTELTFSPGVTYIKGIIWTKPKTASSNGSGKTTLLNAIKWCLYGRLEGGAAEEAINWDSVSCSVYVDLDDLKVWRSRNKRKGSVEISYKGREIESGDADVMNKRIADILRISFTTFCASLYFSKTSTSVQFLKCTPAKRSEILGEFINAEPFRIAAQAVQADLKAVDTDIKQLSREEDNHVSELSGIGNRISNLGTTIRDNQNLHRNKVAKLRDRMATQKVEIERLQEILKSSPEEDMKTQETERVRVSKRIKVLDEEILELHANLGSVRSKIAINEPCPVCLRDVDKLTMVHRTAAINEGQTTIAAKSKELLTLKSGMEVVQRNLAKLRQLQEAKWAAPDKLAEAKELYLEARDSITEPPSLTALKEELEKYRGDMRERTNRLSQVKNEVATIKATKQNLDLLYLGFSTEIKNLLFDRVRQHLHLYTQEYLKHLDGSLVIEYPSTSKTGKEKFDVLLHQDGHDQSIESLSEGEHWRASFAVLLALRRTLLAHAKSRLPVLFVDDPVGGLDDKGTEVFQATLERLAQDEKMTILVTLPRDSLIPLSAKVITVTKTERGSYAKTCG